MTQREFAQWMLFDAIDPLSDERAHDMGPALIASMLVRVMTGAKNISVEDFLPFRYRHPVANEMEAALLRWAEKEGKQG